MESPRNVTLVPPSICSKVRSHLGRIGPISASNSIFRLGTTSVNRVIVSLTLPRFFCRNRNVVPAPAGPSGVFTTDSALGSTFAAFSSRARKKAKTSSTGRAIVTVAAILAMASPFHLGRHTIPRVRRRIGARRTRDLATGVQGLHHRVGTTEGAQVPHVVFLPQDRPHLGPPPEEGKRGPWGLATRPGPSSGRMRRSGSTSGRSRRGSWCRRRIGHHGRARTRSGRRPERARARSRPHGPQGT